MIKNILIFISGMITMLLIIVVFSTLTLQQPLSDNQTGLTMFEQEAACINAKQVKIFQVLKPNMALAYAHTKLNAIYDENEILVLILGKDNENFYDDQKIDIPKGKCAKQVGTYRYITNNGMEKTVPAVNIK